MNIYHLLAGHRMISKLTVIWVFSLLIPVYAFSGENEIERIRMTELSLAPALNVEGKFEEHWLLSDRMKHWNVPAMSIAVIRNGKIAWTKGYGVLQAGKLDKVDAQTVFSVGSLSKVAAAAITLRLVDAGKLDLDRDVNEYLTRWKVPENDYTAIRPVTLRGILSHTSGLSVNGFPDFLPNEDVPDVIDTLEGRVPAKHEPVRVFYAPGSIFRYSGGGTTVQQLIIEEVTGLSFAEAARQYLFTPLGMTRSTFENPLSPNHGNIAKAHDEKGQPHALPRGYETMPEMAASGLWTTPGDYAKLVIAIIASYQGVLDSFLSQALAREMLTEVWPSSAGLGPFLDGWGLDRRFSHSGLNDSYQAYMEGHPNTGNGVVIFTAGGSGGRLYSEMKRAVAASESWSTALSDRKRIRPIDISSAELEEMVGVYTEAGGDRIQIISKDGSLYSNVQTVPTKFFQIIPIDPARFVFEGGYFPPIRFVRDYGGGITGMLVRDRDDPDAFHFFDKTVAP